MFELRIEKVDYRAGEAWILGVVTSGSFAGPEAISLHDDKGGEHHTVIRSHGLHDPVRWPVVPGDGTTVRLTIAWSGELRIDESRPVIGHGVVARAASHVDFHDELRNPLFWATELGFHLGGHLDDPDVDPVEYFFGVEMDSLNAYYSEAFDASWRAGAWPRIRARVGTSSRYVEYEAAAGIEYQTRYWIGDEDEARHVLMGYYSGHFSTPGFRPEEIYQLAELWHGTPYTHLPLLLATVTYGAEPGASLTRFLSESTSGLPGVNECSRDELTTAVAGMMSTSNVRWRRDTQLGWVNGWPYSQRNPESSMSILGPADFEFIERFFAELLD